MLELETMNSSLKKISTRASKKAHASVRLFLACSTRGANTQVFPLLMQLLCMSSTVQLGRGQVTLRKSVSISHWPGKLNVPLNLLTPSSNAETMRTVDMREPLTCFRDRHLSHAWAV